MLHSPVYNDCLTKEMWDAFRARDVELLKQQILERASALGQQAEGDNFRLLVAQLHVTCALYDALRGGHACAFVTDFVNV